MANIEAVAKQAGVSIASVSRVINGTAARAETEERVRKAHQHVLEEERRDPLHGSEVGGRYFGSSLEGKQETNHHEEDHEAYAKTQQWIRIRRVLLLPTTSGSTLRRF